MTLEQVLPSLIQEFRIDILPPALQYVIGVSPIVLAVLLFTAFWPLWVNYIRSSFIYSLKYSVLEIRLPKETFKSPLAMEIFLNGIHNTSDGNWYTQYWKGEFRPYYSLEIISIEGQIKFLIWCESRRKGGVMSALYSQYPSIEITEREDYTSGVNFDPATQKMWAAEFVKSRSKNGVPLDAIPIKTYVDYGLDKDPKEELKVDPMLPMLEFLGSVGPNQQVWIQIMVRAHKKDQIAPGHIIKPIDDRQEQAKKLVSELLMRDPKTKARLNVTVITPEGNRYVTPQPSQFEMDTATAIERAANKPAFDVGIRAIYLAKKELFDTPFGIGGVIGCFKHYNTEALNGFRPNGDKWIAALASPWQDYLNIRRNKLSHAVLDAYKRRSFFYPPYEGRPMYLNTEELATIYHFPGSVAATPTIDRVPSKKSEAPANLPT